MNECARARFENSQRNPTIPPSLPIHVPRALSSPRTSTPVSRAFASRAPFARAAPSRSRVVHRLDPRRLRPSRPIDPARAPARERDGERLDRPRRAIDSRARRRLRASRDDSTARPRSTARRAATCPIQETFSFGFARVSGDSSLLESYFGHPITRRLRWKTTRRRHDGRMMMMMMTMGADGSGGRARSTCA